MWDKIQGLEINLEAVPDTKKNFVKKFNYIPNVDQYWNEIKKAKQK
jgi:hypothetical protein